MLTHTRWTLLALTALIVLVPQGTASTLSFGTNIEGVSRSLNFEVTDLRCPDQPGVAFSTIRFVIPFKAAPALRLDLGRIKMATREARLAEFSQATPKENRPWQILCEDKCGTYVIPYPCHWSDGAWRKVGSAKPIEATVIGWRTAPRSWRRRANVRY